VITPTRPTGTRSHSDSRPGCVVGTATQGLILASAFQRLGAG
jgi:hypothetical protein